MKIKHWLFAVLVAYSATSLGAFSEVENNQLASINEKGTHAVNTALDKLNKSVDAQITNNSEYK